MQAVILAAGEGTRIRPLSASTPKPMLPVGDAPLASLAADAAVEAGAEELVFVVGYEGDAVRAHFGDSYGGVPVRYAVQDEQRGTADALQAASRHLDDDFVVLNGDNVYDRAGVAALFERAPAVAVVESETPENYGVVDHRDGRVTGIVEKPDDPPGNLVNAGAYAFPERTLEWADVAESERGEYEITDVLAAVVDEFDVTPVELDEWLDVGRPWELLEATETYLDGAETDLAGDVSDAAHVEGPAVVEPGATVKPGVTVEGTALIRSGATVGPNALLRGTTVIGPDAKVGHAVEVKNSVLMAGATVGHLSYVGDSILGEDVNFGAGTQVANLRHDEAPVELTVKGERVSTGRRKFGAVVGEGAKTGINTSIAPGVTLSPGSTTPPGAIVLRDR